ncbi:MAG: CinA family nicotinamide mononucleotide deamidase-related protein, partial [Pirellulales bacterium]|nr:CinA family nicotinamide mononucleotide deamidase-related protein [Pirellulales bacterium]
MRAEIVAIGDELVSGQRLDTNSQWLSDQLGQLGVAVQFHSSVGDDLDGTAEVFRAAFDRTDIVIGTGGLGPTADDLARDSLAAAMGVELAQNPEVLDHIRRLFERRGRSMPKRNERQALFPVGTRVIPNPNGSAPGIAAEIERAGQSPCRVFLLPGVPAEMREMWFDTVEPTIRGLTPSNLVIQHRVLKCFGLGESHLEQRVGDIIERGREPSVGITVHEGTITLRITAKADSPEACEAMIGPVEKAIYDQLGKIVLGVDEHDVAHSLAEQLIRRSATVAVAECGTAGWLVRELATVARGESWFRGGTVFGNDRSIAADDVEHIVQLAAECRSLFSADYAIAIGPYFSERADEEPDRVTIVVSDASDGETQVVRLAGHPD